MANIKVTVNWSSERVDEKDLNEGKEYGIYVFDVDEKDFDSELGCGAYDVLETYWFKTKKERNMNYNLSETEMKKYYTGDNPIREYILKATNERGQTIQFTTQALHDTGAYMELADHLENQTEWKIEIVSNHILKQKANG
jgi:hypothetical protein